MHAKEREKEDRSNGTPLQLIASERNQAKTHNPKKSSNFKTTNHGHTKTSFNKTLLTLTGFEQTARNSTTPFFFFFGAYEEYFFENLPWNKRGIGISAGAYFDLGVEPKSHIGA